METIMNKNSFSFLSLLLVVLILAGCNAAPQGETTAAPTVSTEAPVPEQTTVPRETEEDIVYEGDASSYYIDVAYPAQIGRYHTALSEKWDESKYLAQDMCALPAHYYEGNPLDNVGFGFVDLDNDGHLELIIGAVLNAETDPAIFEIWTLANGEPVLLAQGDSENRYILQYAEEDRMWYVVNETSGNATYYLMLAEGKLEVVQGIRYDTLADAENPWFLTYDLDGDASNDQPIDSETANAILESNRKLYTALELFPYIFYNP